MPAIHVVPRCLRRGIALCLLLCLLGGSPEPTVPGGAPNGPGSAATTRDVATFGRLTALPSFLAVDAFFLVRTNSSNIESPSPFFVFGVTAFELSAELVRAFPMDACSPITNNVTSRVAWIEPYHCSIETKIRHCAAAGCVAAVSWSSYRVPGNEMYTQWDGTASLVALREHTVSGGRLDVPFVHVGRDDADLIRNALIERTAELAAAGLDDNDEDDVVGIGATTIGTTVDGDETSDSSADSLPALNISGVPGDLANFHVYLSSSDSPNEWEAAFVSLYFTVFFQVMLGSLHVIVLLVAIAKFKRYYQLRKTRPLYAKIPLVCLAFLIASNLERALYCCIDPMGATHIVPRGYRRVMISISVPWTYASTLLLTFFWSEAISLKHPKQTAAAAAAKKAEAEAAEAAEEKARAEAAAARQRKSSIELVELPAAARHHYSNALPAQLAHGQRRPVLQGHSKPLVTRKTKAPTPPRANRHSKLSVGRAGQYNEPFHLHREEDEDDIDLEEYVERQTGDVHEHADHEHEEEAVGSCDYRRADADMLPHHHLRSNQLQRQIQSAAVEIELTDTVANINHVVIDSHDFSHSLAPVVPPPPPASPPAIPAPMHQSFLPRSSSDVSLHPALTDAHISIASASGASVSSRYGGLKLEPLYVHLSESRGSHARRGSESESPISQQRMLSHGHHDAPKQAPYNYLPPLPASTAVSHLAPKAIDAASSGPVSSTDTAVAAAAAPISTAPEVSHEFLVKYRTAFIVSAVFLALLDLTFSILDSLYLLDWQLLPLVEVVFATIGGLISAMYFYVSWQVMRRFRQEAQFKIRSAEYNATQGQIDLEDDIDAAHRSTPISSRPAAASSPREGDAAYITLDVQRSSLAPAMSSHASHMISDITRAHHDRMIRMSQFLIGSGVGLMLFLVVTLLSPQLWHTHSLLDQPIGTISRDFLLFLALFIVGVCQVCAF